jgi:hypothetical protein
LQPFFLLLETELEQLLDGLDVVLLKDLAEEVFFYNHLTVLVLLGFHCLVHEL